MKTLNNIEQTNTAKVLLIAGTILFAILMVYVFTQGDFENMSNGIYR